jgi:hypothetical protein
MLHSRRRRPRPRPLTPNSLSLTALEGMPEVEPGDALGRLIAAALERQSLHLLDEDAPRVSENRVESGESIRGSACRGRVGASARAGDAPIAGSLDEVRDYLAQLEVAGVTLLMMPVGGQRDADFALHSIRAAAGPALV